MKKINLAEPGCVSAALTVIGDKWSPLIIKSLSLNSMRFTKLQESVGGINPRTLSSRLDKLELAGIITKKTFDETPPHTEYSLTEKGAALIPILIDMVEWSRIYPN